MRSSTLIKYRNRLISNYAGQGAVVSIKLEDQHAEGPHNAVRLKLSPLGVAALHAKVYPMSLLDTFLDDGVLNPPVMQQNYYVALRTDGVKGAGTQDDPYNGTGAANFDWAMQQIPANSTIFLGPCKFSPTTGSPTEVFETQGYPTVGGFRVRSGWKIVGAGEGVTIVKLVSLVAAAGQLSVFGMPLTGTDDSFLLGFEISDLTCDANLPSTTFAGAIGGIMVTGKQILIQRVTVINYGSKNSAIHCFAICGAYASAHSYGYPSDVVIADCNIMPTSANHEHSASGLVLTAGTNTVGWYHESCVIRGCYVTGGYNAATNPPVTPILIGINIEGARGTIVCDNRVSNCKFGGPYREVGVFFIEDLIVRDNFYSNCKVAIIFDQTYVSPGRMGRLIIEGNAIDLPALNTDIYPTFEVPTGIKLNLVGTDKAFKVVIVRGNRVRGLNGFPVKTGSIGVSVNHAEKVTIDANVIDVLESDNAVKVDTCLSIQAFSNRRSDGTLLSLYDPTTQLHVPELTTTAENALLTL